MSENFALPNIKKGLLKIAQEVAQACNDKSKIDDYREVALFKYMAEAQLKNHDVQTDYTQDDINEIFGYFSSLNSKPTNLINETQENAENAYKNGTISRKSVVDLTEAILGTAIADAGRAYEEAIESFMEEAEYNKPVMLGVSTKFEDKAELYAKRAALADTLISKEFGIRNKLTKTEGTLATNPRFTLEYMNTVHETLGMSVEQFLETYKKEIECINALTHNPPQNIETDVPMERIAEVQEKINKYCAKMEEFSDNIKQVALKTSDAVTEIAKNCEEEMAKMKENIEIKGEVEEPQGIVGRYYATAVVEQYNLEQQTGIEQPKIETESATTRKVMRDGKVYIEKTNPQTGEKEVYNMNGQKVE